MTTTVVIYQSKFLPKHFTVFLQSILCYFKSSSLSSSELMAVLNGFKHSSSPEHAHACVQTREIFLHLHLLEHFLRHSKLVIYNRAVGASFNSNVILSIANYSLSVKKVLAQFYICMFDSLPALYAV